MNPTEQFAVTDPRTFDGDPFEVAARACRQAEAVARILAQVAEGAELMARNAEMERNLIASGGEEAGASLWDGSPQARQFRKIIEEGREAEQRLKVLGKAAGFNPKRPPKEA